MDTVRFGRALGVGAREAAKALVKAADAATSPKPTPSGASQTDRRPETPSSAANLGRTATRVALRSAEQVRNTSKDVHREGKRFGEAAWGPAARLSGVLWLEVTGVFFGLFALTAGLEAWKRRADFHAAASARQHAWFALAMLAVFGYFTLSSFIKASRRGRR